MDMSEAARNSQQSKSGHSKFEGLMDFYLVFSREVCLRYSRSMKHPLGGSTFVLENKQLLKLGDNTFTDQKCMIKSKIDLFFKIFL
jgi:hypothetical protein